MQLAATHGGQGRAWFALGARLGRAGSRSPGVLADLVRGWLVWFGAGASWACECAIRVRKQGAGASRST